MHFSTRAFTLVELMIVIAIIGILASALYPAISNYIWRGRDTARIAWLTETAKALTNFASDQKETYPVWRTDCDLSWSLSSLLWKVIIDPILTRNHGCWSNWHYWYWTWENALVNHYSISAYLEADYWGYWNATGWNNPFTWNLDATDINNLQYNLIKWTGALYALYQ